jgi:hypothetical protein
MEVLFITREDITRLTALNGNVDVDKYVQFIKIAQDLHIKKYLGQNLFEKLQSLISLNTINLPANVNYKTLLETYVKYMTIHFSMVEYLPFAAYTLGNKGVFKHTSENGVVVDKEEIDMLIEKERSIAQSYTQRYIDYITNFSSLYPEYNTNTNGQMYPTTKNNFNGWHL